MFKETVKGLTSKQAQEKLREHGLNEIERKQQLSWLRLLWDQFKSPLIYILFFAGLVTVFLKEWTDGVVIFLAVGLNTFLGFVQEFKAEKSLIALKKILIPQARVIRDGQEKLIEAREIVPGDLVVLKEGAKIPADGRLIEAVGLFINEAILTGESIPVEKKKKDQVFMGTAIVGGRGQFLAVKTGMATRMGQLAGKLKETVEEETPLKKQVGRLSRTLAIVFSVACVLIFIEGLIRQRDWLEMFTLSVAVAVAAIPEGLAVSLTVILALGMQRILKRKGLVRRLLAAETLGSVNVICADKTGTLTEGRMKVAGLEPGKKPAKEEILRGAVLCNNLTNPLEIAMIDWARREFKKANQLPASPDQLLKESPRTAEIPFSSERKFIATLHSLSSQPDSKISDKPGSEKGLGELFLSGAPEMVMEMTLFDAKEKLKWQRKLDQLTKKGLRLVAFACRKDSLAELEKNFKRLKRDFQSYDGQIDGRAWQYLNLKWLGFLLFEDPPREEVKKALAICRQAGIKIKVITGDYRNTAEAVLKKLDLAGGELKEEQVMEGWELEKLSKAVLKKKIDQVVLFARTTPEQKIDIVEALQEKKYTVAMMGDGVNDALALKKADIGVVVGEASEVAKETADMVLLDSNFETVVQAVEEGRGIFENIRKVVLYLLSDSFTEMILIGGSLLLGLPAPVLPAQILWVNLVEDGLPGLALAFEPKDKGLMNERPRKKNSPIINQELKILIFVIGLMTDALLFGTFLYLLKKGFPLETVRTIIFTSLAIDSLLYVFSCKTLRQNIWQEDLFSNRFLNLSVLAGFLLLAVGIYLPLAHQVLETYSLGFLAWVLIIALGLINILAIEMVKWFFLRKEETISSS